MSQSLPPKYGIILLAAGASTRLGLPKQLLSYRGTSLVGHVLSVALESDARPVVVVLGANYRHVAREIGEREDVFIVVNEGWREGIASSIRTGLRALTGIADCEGAILAVCDQPLLSAPVLNRLIGRQAECRQPIVASCYGQRIGSPALFHRSLFGQLLSLRGDTGPRKIIKKNPGRLAMVAFPGGELDIDTPGDYDAIPRELRRMRQPALLDLPVFDEVPAGGASGAAGMVAAAPAEHAKVNTREPEQHQPFTTSPPLTWMT